MKCAQISQSFESVFSDVVDVVVVEVESFNVVETSECLVSNTRDSRVVQFQGLKVNHSIECSSGDVPQFVLVNM